MGDCAEMLEIKPVDLNADGAKELLVRGKYDLCGATGNCNFWIFAKRGERYRKLLSSSDYFEGRELGDQIVRSKTNGYRDISVKGHITASDTSYQNYRFTGHNYVASRCVVESYLFSMNRRQIVNCKEFERNWH